MSLYDLAGGLALFLLGLHLVSIHMEKLAGRRLETALRTSGSSNSSMFLWGMGLTMAVQSSGKVITLLVGMGNSGVIKSRKAEYATLGASLGGVGTIWIFSLTAIPGTDFWVGLLNPRRFSLPLALLGLLFLAVKRKKTQDVGGVFLGFCVLMFGMGTLTASVLPLARMEDAAALLAVFRNPVLGLVVGMAVAPLLPGPVAAVGILQAFSLSGLYCVEMAIPLLLGFGAGSCLPALLSAAGTKLYAKRTAAFYTLFTLLGTGICFALYLAVRGWVPAALWRVPAGPCTVALLYTIVTMLSVFFLLPATGALEGLTGRLIRGKDLPEPHTLLDERLFSVPSVALSECGRLTAKMALLSKDSALTAMKLLDGYVQNDADAVIQSEDELDLYEDELGGYLLQLSGRDLSEQDNRYVIGLLRMVSDFERMGDHAVNIMESAQVLRDRGGGFSLEGQREVNVLMQALTEIITMSVEAFIRENTQLARRVEPLEQVVDELVFALKKNHTHRLQNGTCNIGVGTILTDLLTDLERISDHCSNIAVAVIETHRCGFAYHDYLNTVKFSGNAAYEADFRYYEDKYQIPS